MVRSRELAQWVAATGRIVHSSAAYRAGFTKRDLAQAVDLGAVERVRRSWLTTLPIGDPTRRAVSVGGRLTCISEAAHRGLWVPDNVALVHVWVPQNAGRMDRTGMRIHRARGPLPAAPQSPHDQLLNALNLVATCVPFQEALAVWESAIRKTDLSLAQLRAVAWPNPRARRLAETASDLSDSGLETDVVSRLRRLGLAALQQVFIDGHPVDALVGECLILQIDGKHHLDPVQRRRDIRGDARLALMGYTVLRFDYKQVVFGWGYVESTVLMAVAQGKHLAR